MVKKEYRNFFVGAPLHDAFLPKYKKILKKLEDASLGLSVTKTDFPHFTIIFMGNQPEEVFSNVSGAIDRHRHLLAGVYIKISGPGFFNEKSPRVVFSKVNFNKNLWDFQNKISADLSHLFIPSNNDYKPHLTLARISNRKIAGKFMDNKEKIKEIIKQIDWEFELTKICSYGREQGSNAQRLLQEFRI